MLLIECYQLRTIWGVLDAAAVLLLLQRSSRRQGFLVGTFGATIAVYGQLYTKAAPTQVLLFLGLNVLGLLL